jgi:hypothetical protein
MKEGQTLPPVFEYLAQLGEGGSALRRSPYIDAICEGSPYFGGISLLMAFSCWLSAFCSDFVMWPPFWLAMARSSCRT